MRAFQVKGWWLTQSEPFPGMLSTKLDFEIQKGIILMSRKKKSLGRKKYQEQKLVLGMGKVKSDKEQALRTG